MSNIGTTFINGVAVTHDLISTLLPGAGFGGAESALSAVGDPNDGAHAYKPMARWDCVPYQEFTGTFTVGVIAFATSGISKVEFSVDGGAWKKARYTTTNPDTGIVEYCVTLDATDFDDGLVEIRARVYPKSGVPRILAGDIDGGAAWVRGEHSMFLNANSGGTLPAVTYYVDSVNGNDSTADGSEGLPYQTIAEAAYDAAEAIGRSRKLGGMNLLLKNGDYTYTFKAGGAYVPTDETDRLCTIQPAPGATSVKITAATHPGLWRSYVRLKNLTLEVPTGNDQAVVAKNGGFIWFDTCTYKGAGTTYTHTPLSGNYYTDCTIQDGHVAINQAEIVRNCTITNCSEDAIKFCKLAAGVTISNLVYGDVGFHPDVWQGYGSSSSAPIENYIAFQLTATTGIDAQGIGPTHAKDCAFVEVNIDNTPGDPLQNFQCAGLLENILFKDCDFAGGGNNFRTDLAGFDASNFFVKDCSFSPAVNTTPSGVTIE